jgi:hypothetical protein
LNKTLGTIGTPHEEPIAKFNPHQNLSKKEESKKSRQEHPKIEPLYSRIWEGITAQRTMKGSHKFPPSNPQEKGPENNPRKTQRKGSENHHQEQPGTTQEGLEERRRIIYTCNKGSYMV